MGTYDIVLPNDQRPQFPAICVGCEMENPRDLAKIAVTGSGGSGVSWTMDAATLAAGMGPIQGSNLRVKLQVPCCPKCARILERRHFWKSSLLYISGFGGAVAALAIIIKGKALHIPGALVPYVGGAAAVVVVLLPVIWELKWPPGFTITPMAGGISYEFRSKKCAERFAQMNVAETA
jgi:hypothetical protein